MPEYNRTPTSSKSIAPDGSDRTFCRVKWKDRTAVEIQPSRGADGKKEALAFFRIGTHLFRKGIPVPEIYFFDRQRGLLIVEDLGNCMLFDKVSRLKGIKDTSPASGMYLDVLYTLLSMQVEGGKDFDISWCFQRGTYDARVALEKEAAYFIGAFVKDYMRTEAPERVWKELTWLALEVDGFNRNTFFLHRDFQSRNIMMRESKGPAIVDFQAGRLGPLGYDLASLLNDPYAGLDYSMRLSLLDEYVKLLEQADMNHEAVEIRRQWPVLSVLRLLQALGAYAHLTKVKGKSFFRTYIRPALEALVWIAVENFPERLEGTIDLCRMLSTDIEIFTDPRGQ